MQLDMHFYGTYAMARAAGIPPEPSRKIAHSAQFVDDAIDDVFEPIKGVGVYLPLMTAHKTLDYRNLVRGNDQWRVWVCFHFLPGNQGNTPLERLICRRGDDENQIAQGVLDFCMKNKEEPFGLHLAGVAAHVFEDTFAHFGFSGFSSHLNKVDQSSIKLEIDEDSSIGRYLWKKAKGFWGKVAASGTEVAMLGHGAVATFPDRPYLRWKYEYESRMLDPVFRNNPEDYLECCERLYKFFSNFASNNPYVLGAAPPTPFDSMREKIKDILSVEDDKDERILEWKKAIEGGLFPVEPEDNSVDYDEDEWGGGSVRRHFRKPDQSPKDNDTCMFMKAARTYRNYILGEVLPRRGLVLT